MPFHLAIWASKLSEKFRLDRRIGFQNTFYTKCINVIIDSIGPSIILRSIERPKGHWPEVVVHLYMIITDTILKSKEKKVGSKPEVDIFFLNFICGLF